MQKRIMAFDTETHQFGPCNMAPPVVCLTWACGDESGILVNKEEIFHWIHGQLEDAIYGRTLLVGHNVAYDFSCLMSDFPDLTTMIFEAYSRNGISCTQAREKLLDIAWGTFRLEENEDGSRKKSGYSLADILKKHFKITLEKDEKTWRLRYAELEHVPLEDWPIEAVNYAIDDAKAVLLLYTQQEQRTQSMGYTIPTELLNVRASFALRLMSVWGIETDQNRVAELWQKTALRMNEIAQKLVASGLARGSKGKHPTPRGLMPLPEITKNLEAIREAVISSYPANEAPLTDKGNVRTDKTTLADSDSPILRELTEFSALEKSATSFLLKIFSKVVHASYNATGAGTDRSSSFNPNLQQQPRMPGIRECFIARSLYAFVSADYDSQEMRTFAQSCIDIVGWSELARKYQEDRHFDPHLDFAAQLAGITIEEAKRRKKADDKEILELRQQSKAANFGYPGGMFPNTFVKYAKGYGLDIDKNRSTELRESWLQKWPEARPYFEHIKQVTEHGPGVITIPRSGFRRAGVVFTEASNCPFQTLASHASKSALWEVSKACYTDKNSPLWNSRPVIFIHDEIVLETPEDKVHEAGKELARIMVQEMEKWTPNVPSAASPTAMRVWSKKAKAVYDANGRLQIWEPK